MSRCGTLRGVLIAFGLALLVSAFGMRDAHAEITFPRQIPKTLDALSAIINAVPGLSAAGISHFRSAGKSASANLTVKGEAATVVALKRPDVSKVLLTIVPNNFELFNFLPIPRGTSVDGVTFRDMALVTVPHGAARNGVPTSGLPQAVSRALSHSGQHVDFKESLNLFGQADFTSSDAIKNVLTAVGRNQFTLPLGDTFSVDVFRHGLRTASNTRKGQLLVGLALNLPLPRLAIPGMPDIVSVNNAHQAIVGREVNSNVANSNCGGGTRHICVFKWTGSFLPGKVENDQCKFLY